MSGDRVQVKTLTLFKKVKSKRGERGLRWGYNRQVKRRSFAMIGVFILNNPPIKNERKTHPPIHYRRIVLFKRKV